MSATLEDPRLTELELRYTALQELVQQLSDVVYAQGRELEALRARVSMLDKKLAEPGLVDARQTERPPHY